MVTCAVIPTYNEAKHIGEIVRKCKLYVDMVVVADDHSIDRTRDIAREEGAHVVLNPGRQGAGANTAVGLAVACMLGADVIVTLDGDGQHDPNEIPKLLEPILNRQADLVVGVRDV
jgi:glycosyltransferase involved in cell wall biosynthesis